MTEIQGFRSNRQVLPIRLGQLPSCPPEGRRARFCRRVLYKLGIREGKVSKGEREGI